MHSRCFILAAGVIVAAELGQLRAAHAADKSQAAHLLADGRKLMASHDYSEACPKMAESQSLAPSAATAMSLGGCYEKAGKLSAAAEAYRAAATTAEAAHQKPRVAAAKKALASVEAKTPHLTIRVAPESQLPGLTVQLDGEAVDSTDLNVPLPRDVGGHDVQASAPGKKTLTSHVDLKAGDPPAFVEVSLQEAEVPAASDKDAKTSSAASEEAASSAGGDADSARKSRQVLGVVVGAVGFVGVGVGLWAGINANSSSSDLKTACGPGPTCTASNGPSLRDSANTSATESTVGFIAGGALIAAGAILYLTAPPAKTAGPTVGLAPAALGSGLSLVGGF